MGVPKAIISQQSLPIVPCVCQAWKAANFLMGLMEAIGAEAKLVVAVEGTNPVVFGRIIQVSNPINPAVSRQSMAVSAPTHPDVCG